jgi:peptidyl-prolyl cis-trans isomerase C
MLTDPFFCEIMFFSIVGGGFEVFERIRRGKIMTRYLTISAWLVLFVFAFGCRQKPSAETETERPEPNAPAKVDIKAVETKQATKVTADGVAVTVNDVDITEKELEAEIKRMAPLMPRGYIEQDREQFRQLTLDRMIIMQLLDEKAKAANIAVTEEEVLDQIREIASRQKLSLDDFKAMLQTAGVKFDEWKQQVEWGVKLGKLTEAEYGDQLNITENDANNFYSSNIKRFETPEQIKASHILIKPDATDPNIDPNEAKAKALAKAQDLLKQIKEGANFAELAKDNSDCPSKAKGGDLGFFGRGRMEPAFEKAAFALKVNEVSDVVETQDGYHIIKVTDHKEAGVITFEQAKDDIIKMLKQQRQGVLIKKYIESLKAQAKIVYPAGKEPPSAPPVP